MDKVSIPRELPQCKIIEELVVKSEGRTDLTINALSLLDDIRKRVSEEVRQINELFPEYTPHDEYYHLSRLFHIAGKVLGDTLIENLNFSELLILSIALYGHDWGMAVSASEKELIVSDKIGAGQTRSDYFLLPDEHKEFANFLTENNANKKEPVTPLLWQEYVRKTHALRSGERVKRYFEKIHPGIGEAASRVCEAHWLDFKCLEDNTIYPTNFPILLEVINLKAISVYLRLVDLLDISLDRTPYVIWKYVAPQNTRSAMEWKKHRSVHSIACSDYQGGRIIQIDGSTEDHNIYAAIMDLKNFCDEQLKGCNDLLYHINEPKYNLNLFGINWRILASGFKPISIQFDFDRAKMFDILSEEIYQGDKYVFLRELLQNSIDAIKLRWEILEKRGGMKSNLRDFGLIEIRVKHLDNGDAEITISDNGSGMDEYIVKNYLSVAGKSYYRSEDFKKLGLNMDPISRFGVGILSCFMVADRIDIDTFRDPYLSITAERLKIEIPSVTQQFRIQSFVNTVKQPGTQLRVYVSGKKLKNEDNDEITPLNVTDYISNIVGFVDIPIKIDEDERKTLVVGPEDEISKSRFPEYRLQKIEFKFPWDKLFGPDNVSFARQYYKEVILDLQKDLQIKDIQGKIICLEQVDIKKSAFSHINPVQLFIIENKIPFLRDWSAYRRDWPIYTDEPGPFGRSAQIRPQYQVYLDGILIPNIDIPQRFKDISISHPLNDEYSNMDWDMSENYLFLPYILVNFPKPTAQKIDLSRTRLANQNKEWELPVYEKYCSYVRSEIEDILHQKPEDRLISLAQLMIHRRIGLSYLVDQIPMERMALPFIVDGGKLLFKEAKDYLDKRLYIRPDNFNYFDKLLVNKIEKKPVKKGKLDDWQGGEFLLLHYSGHSKQSKTIGLIIDNMIDAMYSKRAIRLLTSQWKQSPPFLQWIYEPRRINAAVIDVNALIDQLLDDISRIDWDQSDTIYNAFNHYEFFETMSIDWNWYYFEKPFEKHFSYGNDLLNLHHPNTKFLFLLMCVVIKYEHKESADQSLMKKLKKKMQELEYFDYNLKTIHISNLNSILQELARILLQLGIPQKNLNVIEITLDCFIPYSVAVNKRGGVSEFKIDHIRKQLDLSNYSKPFQPINP